MLVKDIMTQGARTVTEDTPIREVASLMCLYRYSGLPVVEDEDRLIGFIAEKDVLAQLFPSVEDAMGGMTTIDLHEKVREYADLMNRKVSDLMTRGARTVSPDMPILKAAIIMANNRFRRIPVAEGDRLVGMLSLGDIHKAIFHKSLTEG
ncbi:MAG: signal transduction protein [Gammaproteobacteria bacterium]|nr:MAG: signal transduction protein [Gammaproteobacteria bacterium]RTZ76873.1 MAG: signal transduction protein [Gammaproteobacteria bacterium]RTZ81439.1 MAG: signal transduction protein [Gammaproteobacteria bacterium]